VAEAAVAELEQPLEAQRPQFRPELERFRPEAEQMEAE